MNVMKNGGKSYIGYEYIELQLESSKVSMYVDGYQNFGWQIDENQETIKENGKTLIILKRDRKILNKVELTRLQRNFEDCMKQIEILEKSKVQKANALAIGIGIVGTMFMAGSTFAIVAEPPIIWLCVLLAIPGFAGWILPYFCYKAVVSKRIKIVKPLIEDKYDEIYKICEKGNHLLGNEERSKEEI